MFKFKQFTICQDKTPMKVGTDGVLIGAWADIEQGDRRMLDIGAGTGLIALMLAQRTQGISSTATIDAVEIDEASAIQARENIANSPWSQIINIHNINIVEFNQNFKYDLIVSNPPYFCDSLPSPDLRRTNARHTINLCFDSLVNSVEHLLEPSGRFSLILPVNESREFESAAKGRLYLWKRCNIRSFTSSDYKRVMSEYRLLPSTIIEETELALREKKSNEYTQDYKLLTADFYLKF